MTTQTLATITLAFSSIIVIYSLVTAIKHHRKVNEASPKDHIPSSFFKPQQVVLWVVWLIILVGSIGTILEQSFGVPMLRIGLIVFLVLVIVLGVVRIVTSFSLQRNFGGSDAVKVTHRRTVLITLGMMLAIGGLLWGALMILG